MNEQRNQPSDLAQDVTQEARPVDKSRRLLGKAALAAPIVLASLASRPVLGTTFCMTPSAAGSGNHSQQVSRPACTLKTAQDFITKAKGYKPGDPTPTDWPTNYKPDTLFHPFFTAGSYLKYLDSTTSNSYTLFEVLVGRKWPVKNDGTRKKIENNWVPADWPNLISPMVQSTLAVPFVVALLNAGQPNNYYVVLPDVGEPSVKGIEDEYARTSYYEVSAGNKWYANTIGSYLQNPGSVF